MISVRPPTTDHRLLIDLLKALLFSAVVAATAHAQFAERTLVLPPAEVEQLDAASAAHLENVTRFLAEKQWAEAVEAIRRVQEAEPTRLVKVESDTAGFERFIPAAEYCQWRLASLASAAPEALAHYRRLVDPLAESWTQAGSQSNDELLLGRVAQQVFASRAGDDALLKLGDLALARGEPALARGLWERIAPGLTVPASAADKLGVRPQSPLWLPLRSFDLAARGTELAALLQTPAPAPLGIYPDTDLNLASVRARLVLASLLEGSRQRTAGELALLRLLAPSAQGKLGGRQGRYADMLGSLLEESAAWPPPRQAADWATFAGDAARSKVPSGDLDPAGQPLWTYKLPRLESDREWIGTGRLRPADDMKALLSYHPLVVAQKVFVRLDARENSFVAALDLKTGQPLWQVDYKRGLTKEQPREEADQPWAVSDAHAILTRHIGVARYTLSARGGKLFARMGSPLTMPRERPNQVWLSKDQGFLLGLDLATQGKPLEGFPIRPPSAEWSFEGTPLSAGGVVYVAMRKLEGSRSQIYLAAFELQTTSAGVPDDRDDDARPSGRLKWRTRICSAATLGAGEIDQLTHLLVTLDSGRLYLNTNAGAVAAVDAADGRLQWLVKYPRAEIRLGDPDRSAGHLFRDLTPCVAWQDVVIVAPSDCDRIFALYAASGQLAWTLPAGAAADAVHLLGVNGDVLLASGDSLYWIDAHTGKQLAQFPPGRLGGAEQAAAAPRGLGRGVIADGHVWFPTRESIFVFDVKPTAGDFGQQPRLVRTIPLIPRGASGGNLVIADGILLIASGDKLTAFSQ
jgi:outer membrane protein assembly factor BamB